MAMVLKDTRRRVGAREAAILLAHGLGVERSELVLRPERVVPRAVYDWLLAACEQRRLGVPLPYLTGFAYFWDMRLRVNHHVLVPRPETELLVETVLAERPQVADVADVGTGSGAVAIALARSGIARVYACDISAQALTVARSNIRRCGVANHVRTLCGDLLDPLVKRGIEVDWLVMNPPYVAPGETVDEAVRFEPESAVYAPSGDPLHFYRRLAQDAPRVLRTGGSLAVEVAAGRAGDVAGLMEALNPHAIEIRRDLAGTERVVIARGIGA